MRRVVRHVSHLEEPSGSSEPCSARTRPAIGTAPRHDWTLAQAEALFALPFADLIFGAQRVHRAWHAAQHACR